MSQTSPHSVVDAAPVIPFAAPEEGSHQMIQRILPYIQAVHYIPAGFDGGPRHRCRHCFRPEHYGVQVNLAMHGPAKETHGRSATGRCTTNDTLYRPRRWHQKIILYLK
jgi:hypothetical protein